MLDNLSSHPADQYDSEVVKTIPFYREIHNQAIDLVSTYCPNVLYWLDTGCGTGTFITRAISKFPNCTFYLSDPSEKMLELCRTKLEDKKVEFVGCYATHELPNEEDSFEVITAIQSHHYLNKEVREETTHKCFSLLKQGGIYITFENFRPYIDEAIEIGLKRWVNFQCSSGKTFEEANKHRKRFDNEYFPITVAEHLDLLNKAGFRTYVVFWLSYLQAGFYAIK